jgi:hypothetical protein
VDEAISRHQQRLDAVSDKILELEHGGHPQAAARLRSLHRRVSGAFAELRRRNADDWRSMRADAESAMGELEDEMRSADRTMIGLETEKLEE